MQVKTKKISKTKLLVEFNRLRKYQLIYHRL